MPSLPMPSTAPTSMVPPGSGAGMAGAHPAINPYIYTPSFSMAVFGAMAFILLSAASTIQLIRYKTWYFNLIPTAAIAGAVGMVARTHSVLNIGSMTAFAVSMFALQIPHSLLVFGNIFTFTRMMWWVTPNDKRNSKTLLLPPRQMSLLWGSAYIVGEVPKSIGSTLRTNQIAHKAHEIGIVYQVLILATFTAYVVRFMRRSRHWQINNDALNKHWTNLGWTITAVATILTLRAVYLIIEFDGQPTPLTRELAFIATHEWTYWVADIIPYIGIIMLFSLNHPGTFLPFEYTRFQWKVATIERLKLMPAAPLVVGTSSQNELSGWKTDETRVAEMEIMTMRPK